MSPTEYADAISRNTNRYLANQMTREEWSERQRELWDAVPESARYEVCRILVPFGGNR